MGTFQFVWDLDDDSDGNVQHIAEHGLTKYDVEHAMENAWRSGVSRSKRITVDIRTGDRRSRDRRRLRTD